MKNTNGYAPMAKIPSNQGYMGYLTHKQLQQLNKYKKDQESDRDTVISGHSNKGRRMKLRQVSGKFQIFLNSWGAVLMKFLNMIKLCKFMS